MTDPFHWIGVVVAIVIAGIIVAALVFAIIAIWRAYGPEFLCKRPGAINVWSVFRSDVRGGEGERIKGAPDLRITRIIGCSWRHRWYAGLILFKKDDGQ